jgi:hypothetical protein
MGRYWRCIGHYNGEGTTYESVAGGFQASPYTPDEDARLIGIRLIQSPEAATSLVQNYQVRLSCTTFKPNVMHVGGNGNGLATVPQATVPPIDYSVDQPVKSGVPITIEARHAVATAVTANVMIFGMFQS